MPAEYSKEIRILISDSCMKSIFTQCACNLSYDCPLGRSIQRSCCTHADEKKKHHRVHMFLINVNLELESQMAAETFIWLNEDKK